MKINHLFAILLAVSICRMEAVEAPSPFATPVDPVVLWPSASKIDGFVFGKLKRLEIEPAQPCSDPVFLRRVYLDAIGTLPTMKESKDFLDDKSARKRVELVDRLLARDEFSEYWGMKWCDTLRVKAEFPVNLWPNAAQAYDRWIRSSVRDNLPYSRFASELLTANGSNFRVPQVNFYRSAGSKDPKAIARAVALTFMGERAEKWPAAKLENMAEFFSQIGFKATNEWKEEIVYYNGIEASSELKKTGTLPDGSKVRLSPEKDPREAFVHWLITSPNSPFARNAVNRIWFWLMGRGIIQEPDDSRPDNPPSNPELLAFLSQELIANNFDVKQIYRLILNSRTYQLSCIPKTTGTASDGRTSAAELNFAFYPIRRVEAETLIDGIDQITGGTEEYSSMTPEPFTWVPDEKRSISLPDGSIGSAFLDLFGRPPRDTGLLTERTNRPTAAQRLHLLNSSHIQSKITKSEGLRALMRAGSPAEITERIYLTVLSRYPTAEEQAVFKTYSQTSEAKGWQVYYDTTWALINSSEFIYRH